MKEKTWFQRIEEKIQERERLLGRPLTVDEQDQAKFEAMNEGFVDASARCQKEDAG